MFFFGFWFLFSVDAALREKLNNIMSSEYFTTTPEMKAPVEVAVAAAGGNYVSFHVPVHGFVVPVEVEQPVFQSQEKVEFIVLVGLVVFEKLVFGMCCLF